MEKQLKERQQNVQKIVRLKSSLGLETIRLNRKLELYLKRAQKETDDQINLLKQKISNPQPSQQQ